METVQCIAPTHKEDMGWHDEQGNEIDGPKYGELVTVESTGVDHHGMYLHLVEYPHPDGWAARWFKSVEEIPEEAIEDEEITIIIQ